MAQKGFVFRKGKSWFLKYRENKNVDGQIVCKQKCVKLAEYCDRYRCESDLDELVTEKMAGVHQAAKCPHSSDSFERYVEDVYLPIVLRTMKPATNSGYKAYWERYIKPRVEEYAGLEPAASAVTAWRRQVLRTTYKAARDCQVLVSTRKPTGFRVGARVEKVGSNTSTELPKRAIFAFLNSVCEFDPHRPYHLSRPLVPLLGSNSAQPLQRFAASHATRDGARSVSLWTVAIIRCFRP